MGQFSMEILGRAGSVLSGNQHLWGIRHILTFFEGP
jgi:hypothetical protein